METISKRFISSIEFIFLLRRYHKVLFENRYRNEIIGLRIEEQRVLLLQYFYS